MHASPRDRKPNKFSVISLFSGCGGMDLGFKQAGFEIAWANDIDHASCETYRQNIGDHIVEGDVEDIPVDRIPPADVIIGGFPCQDFSVVWERPGLKGIRGNLYLALVRTIEAKQPLAFVAENVRGLLTANRGRAIKKIIDDFEHCGAGYNLNVHVYNFADYGVPQTRERVVITGIRRDLGVIFVPPKPTHSPENYVTVLEAFEGVEEIPFNNEKMKIKKRTEDMLKQIPEGKNFKSITDKNLKLHLRLPLSLVYRRLDRNKPAYTVVANGGGGTWTYHYQEPRPLTNRERARLQTFPDDFIFYGGLGEVRTQIGNAVPPLGARPIADQLKRTLWSALTKTTLAPAQLTVHSYA